MYWFFLAQRKFEVQKCPLYCIDNSSTRSLNIWTNLLILHRCKNLRKDQTAKLVMSDTVFSLLREQFVIHHCVEPGLLYCVFALSSSELNRANPKNINWIKLSYFYILFIFFFRLCALNIYRGIMRFSLWHRTTTAQSQLLPYFAEMNCKKENIVI